MPLFVELDPFRVESVTLVRMQWYAHVAFDDANANATYDLVYQKWVQVQYLTPLMFHR